MHPTGNDISDKQAYTIVQVNPKILWPLPIVLRGNTWNELQSTVDIYTIYQTFELFFEIFNEAGTKFSARTYIDSRNSY